jgi:hypothetical protein
LLTKTLIEQTEIILQTLPNLLETFVDERSADAENSQANQNAQLARSHRPQTVFKTQS